MLIDPGSWGNLAGSPWVQRTATLAQRFGLKATQTRRSRPLCVTGVGSGSQQCRFDCQIPIALRSIDGKQITGTFTTPTLNDGTSLPALLGLKTLMEQRAVIDFRTLHITFCGPEDLPLRYPTGSDTFQLRQASSGHLMLPCCDYPSKQTQNIEDGLVLVTEPAPASQ